MQQRATARYDDDNALIRERINRLPLHMATQLKYIIPPLQSVDPLAASLLHRKIVEYVLKIADHQAYDDATDRLILCGLLSLKIAHWEAFTPHAVFLDNLKRTYGKRSQFWDTYKAAIAELDILDPRAYAPQSLSF